MSFVLSPIFCLLTCWLICNLGHARYILSSWLNIWGEQKLAAAVVWSEAMKDSLQIYDAQSSSFVGKDVHTCNFTLLQYSLTVGVYRPECGVSWPGSVGVWSVSSVLCRAHWEDLQFCIQAAAGAAHEGEGPHGSAQVTFFVELCLFLIHFMIFF